MTFRPKKVFKTECSGVDEQSVHLEINCHCGGSEPQDVVLGGRSVGIEMLLGCSEHGRFIKAPEIVWRLPTPQASSSFTASTEVVSATPAETGY